MRFDAHWLAARGEGPSSSTRAGPAPAVPSLVAGETRGGRKRRLPLGFVRAAAYRTQPWVVGHLAASGIPSVLIPLCALLFSLSFLGIYILWTRAQCYLDTCGL
jgi:hypothetical protein